MAWSAMINKTNQDESTDDHLECELFKSLYNCVESTERGGVKEKGTVVKILRVPPPFIVLENFTLTVPAVHVCTLANGQSFKIGRTLSSDVKLLCDVASSRVHAILSFQNNSYFLEDAGSKFGTLIAMKQSRVVDPTTGIVIQVGRTLIRVQPKEIPEDRVITEVVELGRGSFHHPFVPVKDEDLLAF